MTRMVLIRHGQSVWNAANRFTGWTDVELSLIGKAEAAAAGEQLADVRFDVIHTSALIRAQATAEIVMSHNKASDNPPTRYDERLNERHYGDLQGLDKGETATKYGDEQVLIWRRSFDVPPPGGESLKDTAARTLPWFEANVMEEVRDGRNILVAAHGNSLRAIVMELEKLTPEEILKVNIGTGIPLVYEIGANGSVTSKRILEA